MAKYIKDLKLHPEAVDALVEVKSAFHLLDIMMTRLGRISAGEDISKAHDLLTTAWVAVRKIKLQHPAPKPPAQKEPELATVQTEIKPVKKSEDPFTSW